MTGLARDHGSKYLFYIMNDQGTPKLCHDLKCANSVDHLFLIGRHTIVLETEKISVLTTMMMPFHFTSS